MQVDNLELRYDFSRKNYAIHVLQRNEDNKFERSSKVVQGAQPYFYVLESEDIESKQLDGLVKIELGFVTYDGKQAKKLVFKDISKEIFSKAKEKFEISYEDDLPFLQRFIIDNKISFNREQRIMHVDIETDNCLDVDDPREVVSITCYDSFLEKYVTFVWRSDLEVSRDVNNEHIICYYKTEQQMFGGFINFVRVNFPDILVGWASNWFDVPYIINRMKKLNINPGRLSQTGNTYTFVDNYKKERRSHIGGTALLDLKQLYEKIVYRKPPDFRLDTIAYILFGDSKLEVTDVGTMWRQDLKKLVEYNKKDVELGVRIDERVGLTSYFLGLQQLVPMNLEDIFHYSKVVDYHILNKYHNIFVFPSKRQKERVDFEGATVFDPVPGLHKNVVLFDVSSMYSNIYRTFNISPDTVTDNVMDAGVMLNGIGFLSHSTKKGFIPSLLDDLLLERDRLKSLRDNSEKKSEDYKKYDELQGQFKAILNSFYGVTGYSNFRLFDPRISASITFVGRSLLQGVKEYLESDGYLVLYGDTDGIFVKLDDSLSLDNVVTHSFELQQKINNFITTDFAKRFGEIPENYLQMKIEKVFSSLFLSDMKKKYFGRVIFDGTKTFDFYQRGWDTSRRDVPLFFKERLERVYHAIADLQDYDSIKKLCKQIEEELKQLEPFSIAIPVSITKNLDEYLVESQHIKGAKFSNLYLGKDFKQSAVCRLIFVKKILRPNVPQTEVALIDRETNLDGIIVDVNKHIDKLFYDKLEPIFNVLGWVLPNDAQTRLTSWL